MREQLEPLRAAAMTELGDDASAEQIEAVRVRVLGRGGELTDVMRRMREVAAEERPAIGQLVNQIKREIESRVEALQVRLRDAALARSLGEARLDVSLPGARIPRGRLHPLSLVMVQVQDTFFLPGGMLLRTHPSNGQVRVIQSRKPPLAVVCPGNCYRRDELSVRASPMFSQIEGFMVDRAGVITMGHLKGVLTEFLRAFFGPDTGVRFRSSFFPFTEPSAEVDISCLLCHGAGCRVCKQSGWTEILGSGMIHPNVIRAVGYDPAEYQGFAWGMGVERPSQLKLGVDDMRLFYENDMHFLNQFRATSEATS